MGFGFEMENKPYRGGGEVAAVSQLHYLAKICHLAVAQAEPHRIQHYNSEPMFERFWFVASTAKGFDGLFGH